jgi:hypothetical protein
MNAAWPGVARQGPAGQGETRRGRSDPPYGLLYRDMAGQGRARLDKARYVFGRY